MIQTAEELAGAHGVTAACAALSVPRSSLYRARPAPTVAEAVLPEPEAPTRPAPPRALSSIEKALVRELLNSERFQDLAPREVYAELLDEERYLCSVSTMYRILAEHAEVRERRNQLRHPAYQQPELLATGPNQVWSWDITKLRGPSKGLYYYLYVIIDIYSRYVVGWLIAEVESAELAEQLIAETCAKQGVQRAQLTLHADNGSPMIAKTVAILLADLGVAKSHSRPHVSNDNPYSEAQFKTLKYRLDYPERFGSLADARTWGRSFFTWYNHQHHHTGLGLLTPAAVHAGRAETVRQQRQMVLEQAFQAHPERFVKGAPHPAELPEAAWINPPKSGAVATTLADDQPPCPQPSVRPSGGAPAVAPATDVRYTAVSGPEDRATLRSDLSAGPADGVAGQRRHCASAPLPATLAKQELHCP
jgi:putative transposase